MSDIPQRGDVWWLDLGTPIGHEAGLARPALVVSATQHNQHGLVMVCPITRSRRGYPTRVELEADASGLPDTSYVQVEQLRTISVQRLTRRAGAADAVTMARVGQVVRYLLAV